MSISLMSDIHSEAGVIATLVYNPEFILHSEHLKPKHFFNIENASIYWAILELYKSSVTNIDAFNLSTMINSNTAIKRQVEKLNIPSIQEYVDVARNIARHTLEEYKLLVEKILTMSFKRELYKKLQVFQTHCLDVGKNDLGELHQLVYSDLGRLSEEFIMNSDGVPEYKDVIDDVWSKICNNRVSGEYYGYPWKFPILNDYCQIQKSELLITCGQRKSGKSMLLLNQCVSMIKNGVSCLYIDTELSTERFTERMLAHLTKVPIQRLRLGNYSPTEEIIIKDAIALLKTKKFTHIYMPSANEQKIYALCKMTKLKSGLEVVFYDYIKGSSSSSSEMYNELGNRTNFLKNEIAGALDLAVVAGAQLNRNMEISDSFKIEMYASTIINGRHKKADEIANDGVGCGNYLLWVKLNRNGDQHDIDSSEYIDIHFDGSTATMEQTAQQHTNEVPEFMT